MSSLFIHRSIGTEVEFHIFPIVNKCNNEQIADISHMLIQISSTMYTKVGILYHVVDLFLIDFHIAPEKDCIDFCSQ